MSVKAPKWFDHINAIIATIGTGQFKSLEDQKTYNVMKKVIDGLMSKSGIDGSVLHAFATNIQVRVGLRDFTVDGPVYLTRHQQTHARAKGWDQLPSLDELRSRNKVEDADQSRIADDLVDAYPLLIRIASAFDPRAIREPSAKMPRELAEKLEFWLLNEMKRNEMNHEPDMIAASPQVHEEVRTSPDVHDGTQPPLMPEHEDHKVDQRTSPRGPRPQISVWLKETKGKLTATGNLEMNGRRYRLVFGQYDWTLERLAADGFENDTFRQMLNSQVYPFYRSAEIGSELRDLFQTSAIYADDDSFARKPPIASEACVALEWSDDNQLTGAVLINSDETQFATIKKHASGVLKGVFA
ncbi:hypothetical protein [Sphingomonas paucimobilis]|uniref:hypothetical protein n=1 Tax=Sphingomonas paucimobilis TaxID=13689 RepID=UPI0031DEA5CE